MADTAAVRSSQTRLLGNAKIISCRLLEGLVNCNLIVHSSRTSGHLWFHTKGHTTNKQAIVLGGTTEFNGTFSIHMGLIFRQINLQQVVFQDLKRHMNIGHTRRKETERITLISSIMHRIPTPCID